MRAPDDNGALGNRFGLVALDLPLAAPDLGQRQRIGLGRHVEFEVAQHGLHPLEKAGLISRE